MAEIAIECRQSHNPRNEVRALINYTHAHTPFPNQSIHFRFCNYLRQQQHSNPLVSVYARLVYY